jgi:endonuclease/exonuclease/phosphatase (EEP) superfamily protein YafD
MTWDGDRGWLATLFLFGPRWICAIPLPFLAIAAAVCHRRMLLPLAIAAVVIVGPVMGFEMHWPAAAGQVTLRVLTCNVGGQMIGTSALADLIDQARPDVVALQEASGDTKFLWPAEWHVVNCGPFILASRFPITEREHVRKPISPWGEKAAVRFTVQLPEREIQVFNLHLESPRPGLEAVLNRKTGIDISQIGRFEAVLQMRAVEAERTSAWIAAFPGPKIIMGDFNTPMESTVFRRCWSGLDNAFSKAGWGFGFTKISEKRGWSYGARIDHVLYNPDWRCARCWVGQDVGSDHLPLLADFEQGH